MTNDLAERIFNATVSIEGLWPIPFCQPSEAMVDAFEYEDELPDALGPLIANWSEDEKDQLFGGYHQGIEAWEELSGACARKGIRGYLIKASHPVYTKTGSGASFSWGHIRLCTFFRHSAEDAIIAACEWAENAYDAVIDGGDK